MGAFRLRIGIVLLEALQRLPFGVASSHSGRRAAQHQLSEPAGETRRQEDDEHDEHAGRRNYRGDGGETPLAEFLRTCGGCYWALIVTSFFVLALV